MAVVLGRKPGGSGGGGSTPGAAIVRGPFEFAFDDAGLEDGIAFYTPTVGDLLLDAWVNLIEAFDGTTPQFDFGPDGRRLFHTVAASLGLGGNPDSGTDILFGGWPNQSGFNLSLMVSAANYGGGSTGYYTSYGRFITDTPLEMWVSQDGQKGGAAVGGSAGAARIYIVTATPVAF